MPSESDRAYFERRAIEERSRAANAADPASYRIHTEFAREYERRLQSIPAPASASRIGDPVA